MPQHVKCLATVIYDLPLITMPVSNCHLFSDINISQGSVAAHLRCGGIISYHFTAKVFAESNNERIPSIPSAMSPFGENRLRFEKVIAMSLVVQFFLTQCTYA